MVHPKGSTELKMHDLVCVIGRSEHVEQLNKLFSGESKLKKKQAFFGPFVVDGSALLSDIAHAYGFSLADDESKLTLGEFMAARVGGHPVVGDDVNWHDIHWVVNEVAGDRVLKVGVRFSQTK